MRCVYLFFIFCILFLMAASCVYCEQGAPPASPKPSEQGKPYTSVIIDASGLALDRCMSPKIRRGNGSEVWGTVNVDIDYVEEHGIVGYVRTIDEAMKCDRCGSNPLILRAIARAGGAFNSDPVISDADADLMLDENRIGKFLDKFNVIFIKDGQL